MERRIVLKVLVAAALSSVALIERARAALRRRVTPSDSTWPSPADWEKLRQQVGGRLVEPRSPFLSCGSVAQTDECKLALQQLRNPYFLGDQVALTQTSGWANAWTSVPSTFAIIAESTADVVAGIKFAQAHRLRLVVKGGGHSYQGTSCGADSLLIWTRHLNQVTLHDAFVPHGCAATPAIQPAVSLGAGAMWIDAYDAVTTKTGRYVQGGGCTTVGVAGLVLGGGFGSFSKCYGTAAAGLLEAEVVTADGEVRIANACLNPDLFWALKGGGGATFGVLTRITLRTRQLPEFFGAVFGQIKASSDSAFRALIGKALAFYKDQLFNPHWGEQMVFNGNNTLRISMVFQGLTQESARAVWAPFIEWVGASPEYSFAQELEVIALPARKLWDAEFLKQHAAGVVAADDRRDAPKHHIFWAGDQGQVGWFIHGYKSAWLPAALLADDQQAELADALLASTRHWSLSLHFNKGLAGAPAEEIEAARKTAMNPAVLDAFALVIIADGGAPAFTGMPNTVADSQSFQSDADAMGRALGELQRVAPTAGSYVSESDFFDPNWKTAFWGIHYSKLLQIKRKYDPDRLFAVHHGIGSE